MTFPIPPARAALARRSLFRGIGLAAGAAPLAAGSLWRPALAQAAPPVERRMTLDNTVTVTRMRLDNLVATWHATFNTGDVLRAFDPAMQGAGSDVRLSRIITTTELPGTGERVTISGLLAIPAGATGRIPVVSWQHGTIFGTDSVPSNLTRIAEDDYVMRDGTDSAETLFMVQRLAANGFAVIGADYIGKGPLRDGRPEAYVVKEATTRCCLDMLDAGIAGMRSLGLEPGPLFLHGWSQGAINTQWLAQALQDGGRPARAAAAASPFNDLNETFRWWAGGLTYPAPTAAAYPAVPDWVSLGMIIVLGSYQTYYGLDGLIEAAVRPEYHEMALKFWPDEGLDFDPAQHFPKTTELLTEGLFQGFIADVVSRFLRQLAANRATFWDYAAPMRFFYGLADEAIHPVLAQQPLAAGGARIDGAAVPRGTHRITFLASLYGNGAETSGQPDLLTWFRSRLPG